MPSHLCRAPAAAGVAFFADSLELETAGRTRTTGTTGSTGSTGTAPHDEHRHVPPRTASTTRHHEHHPAPPLPSPEEPS
ncbi:hypothetical protein [Streptomyces collinus]|uniref:hypothetical protein n=1 Tax=Streptomyces collinus TaxID=42684 RepID=UPI00363EAB52